MLREKPLLPILAPVCTCGLIHKDPGVDDSPKPRKHVLHILLSHGPREPADVQVGIFDDLWAWASIGYLKNKTSQN